MPTSQASVDRLNTRIAPAVAAWVDRLNNPVPVELGSDLDLDDELGVPGVSVSFLVAHSITQAVDNLQCMVECLTHQRVHYARAMDSMLRSALVGAAQALWILAPDDRPVRQWRCVLAWEDDLQKIGTILSVAKEIYPDGEHDDLIEVDTAKWEQDLAALKAWKQARRRPDGELNTFQMTRIMPIVAPVAFGKPVDVGRPIRDGGLLVTWKYLSSSIHATPSDAIRRQNRAAAEAKPTDSNADEVLGYMSGVVTITSEIFKRFDQRIRRPEAKVLNGS